MGHTSPVVVQTSFRGRNDDGSEVTATWIDNVNVNWAQNVDENFRIRFLVQETAGGTDNNILLQLQYTTDNTNWFNVTGSSNTVVASLSSNFVDQTSTIQRIGSGTFITPNAGMDEVDGIAGEGNVIDFISNEVEVEYCVQIIGTDTGAGANVGFRVTSSGTRLSGGETNIPYLSTVVAAKTLSVPLLTDTDSFFSPTILLYVSAPLISGADTLFSHTVTSNYPIQTPLLSDGDTLFTPINLLFDQVLSTPLFTDDDTFFAHAITTSYTIVSPLLTDEDTFFAHNIATGALTLITPLLTDGDTFFSPTTSLVETTRRTLIT